MQLSTGRKVIEYLETNGSTLAVIEGGAEMTDAEWEEYCAYVRKMSLEQQRARLARRSTHTYIPNVGVVPVRQS